jgi:hypothetical protein
MNTTVSTLLIVGVLINLVKASDMILRPHQQKRLQESFERLTLWLEDTKPLNWYKSLTTSKGKYILLALSLPAFMFLAVPRLGIGFGVVSAVFYYAFLRLIFRSGLSITNWLLGTRGFASFINRFFLFTAIEAIAFVLFIMTFRLTNHLFERGEDAHWLMILALIVLILLLLLLLINILSGAIWLMGWIVVTATATFLLLEILLKVLRGVAWRIVEHNRGVFAAITFIATILLGIAELYLRLQK